MSRANAVGRLSILAVGLSIVIGTAATAAAAPTMPVDPAPVVPDLTIPAADPAAGLDLSIWVDGVPLFQSGTADAESGTGGIAIAFGNNSFANASTGQAGSGLFNTAVALGNESDAQSGGGNFDSAFADTDSKALAIGGNSDTAVATDGGFAEAGGNSSLSLPGNNDFAYYDGPAPSPDTGALAGFVGDDTTAGSNDIAAVFDPSGTVGSLALAGDGNFDLAAVFGDALSSTAATGGNFLVDIVPSL